MRVLILGASGFLGRPVHSLLAAQPDLQVMAGPRSREVDLATAPAAVWDDLLDAARPGVVVNCAGRIGGSPDELMQANAGLVRRLLETARNRQPAPWLIHLGSAAEYGAHPGQVGEDTPPRPESPYGQSKLAGSLALLEARAGLPVSVLRVGNPVGAGQSPQTLLGRAAAQFRTALERQAPQVEFGDLSAARDFIDARDVARAVLAALRCGPASTDGVINVGRGEAVSARSLVTALARICRYGGLIHETQGGSARSGAVPWQQADITRLRGLGWTPAYSLQDALRAVWGGPAQRPTGRQAVA